MRVQRILFSLMTFCVLNLALSSSSFGAYPVSGKGTIEGYVWLPDGSPAVNATVRCELHVVRERIEWTPDFKTETKTDKNGYYRLEVFGEGGYMVLAELAGYAPAFESRIRPNVPTDFHLETGQPLTGRITAKGTNEPISRVPVYVVYSYSGGWDGQWYGPVETGRNGIFRFPQLPYKRIHRIVAQGSVVGWANESKLYVGVERDKPTVVDIELERGAVLTGRVKTTKGEPLPDVDVHIVGQKDLDQTVRTNRKGEYRLAGVPKGLVNVTVDSPRYTALNPEKAGVSVNGGTKIYDVRMMTGAKGSGVVKNARGELIPGANVYFSLDPDKDFALDGDGWIRLHTSSIHSGPDGSFSSSKLPVGRSIPVAWAPGYLVGFGDEVVIKSRGAIEDMTIALRDGVRFEGRVTSATGKPVAGATVRVIRGIGVLMSLKKEPACPLQAITDEDGYYSLEGIEWTYGILWVSAAGYAPAHHKFKTQELGDTVKTDFTLDEAATISGTVTDSGGKPIYRAKVKIHGKGQGSLTTPIVVVMTDANGRYEVPAVKGKSHSLTADHTHYIYSEINKVSCDSADADIILYRPGAIEGELVNYPEQAEDGVTLTAKNVNGRAVVIWFSAKEGTFRVENLYPGLHSIEAGALGGPRGYRADLPATIMVEEGKTTKGVKVSLKRTEW